MEETNSRFAVRFDTNPTYFYYEKSDEEDLLTYHDRMRESMDRIRGERSFLHAMPKTQLDHVSQVFEECRKHDITVIFGNLGRHPMLLEFYLDFLFTANESVGCISQWKMSSQYQLEPPYPSLDYLFVVEPYFGYTVLKPPQVKHLVVLTSHLVLNITDCHMTKLLLIPPIETQPCYFQSSIIFKPPVFHDGKVNQIPPRVRVLLDVSDASSAHEAFLRLLTGQEMASDRIVTIKASPRNQKYIQQKIKITRERVISLNWQEDLILDKYLNFLLKPYTIFQKSRIK